MGNWEKNGGNLGKIVEKSEEIVGKLVGNWGHLGENCGKVGGKLGKLGEIVGKNVGKFVKLGGNGKIGGRQKKMRKTGENLGEIRWNLQKNGGNLKEI